MIGGSEIRNRWLCLELQSSRVADRRSNKEIKNAPSALLSCISMRELLRTREECFFPSAYITQQCTRNKFLISVMKF